MNFEIKKGAESPLKHMSLNLPTEHDKQLKKLATKHNVNKGEVVRQMIIFCLSNMPENK